MAALDLATVLLVELFMIVRLISGTIAQICMFFTLLIIINNNYCSTKYTGVQLPPWYYFDSVLAFGYAFDSVSEAINDKIT